MDDLSTTLAILLGAAIVIVLILLVKVLIATKTARIAKKEKLELEQRAEHLWVYQKVHDAERESHRILAEAKSESDRITQQAKEFIEATKQNAHRMTSKAEEDAKSRTSQATIASESIRKQANEILALATGEAQTIVEQANAKAKEIAGDALQAKEKAELYEKTAKAMKNIVDGYGDEYLIANKTTIDDLAEEFSHKNAGVELKNAKANSKNLVTQGKAATCDYVEASRKRTAVRFVLDAFNGKVDTALSKVRHDNYGKLGQEMQDAYGLVNGNGKAFRNARITEEYLAARLAELRWAVASNELKIQEREEQQRIKAAMREEERARREIEKAIKEAEKEERLLKKAMEQARQQLGQATEEQRQQYEKQLTELQEKLTEAEENNQRAMSMAQQTRRGHVYVLSNIGSFGENVYKIGLTRRLEPLDRVKELGDASVPFEFDVHAIIYAEDAPELEKELHRRFEELRVNKINLRKEFFRVLLRDIRSVVESKNVETHWTMMAEAREYRETLALEMTAADSVSPNTQPQPEIPR